METPASMRRVTRSQTALQKTKIQDEAKRLPLLDISNDSPIIGLTISKTPINNSSKKDCISDNPAPQSGQKILRTQVKTLLQNFEEEKDDFIISQQIVASPCEEKNQFSNVLLFDLPEKSEISYNGSADSSSLTCETRNPISLSEDDQSSVWSTQVNASSEKEEFEEDYEEEFEDEYEEEFEEEEEEGDLFDDLCKGMNKMCIMEDTEKGKKVNLPDFMGTRTKFVYNSEDEIEDEVTILRGLPAPEGTHLRFRDEENE